MENDDLEHGVVEDVAQESLQRLLHRIKNKDDVRERITPWISTIPNTMREQNPWCFTPRVVSIGPLHKHDAYLRAFETQKTAYVSEVLNPSSKSEDEETLKLCIEKVYASMNKIKACYDQPLPCGDIEFVEMMVMDACFILGFVSHPGLRDHIVIYDLMLLENQIPFFLLNEIYECTLSKPSGSTSLVEYLFPLLSAVNLFTESININNISIETVDHILSLSYECYKPPPDLGVTFGWLTSRIHSAVDLDRAGVNFKPAKNSEWVMGMDVNLPRFPCFSWCWSKPTLSMPVLYVNDFTELILRNLITYEQQSMQTHMYITSYAYAMDILVNTKEDVAKLVESEVLVNDMGTNEDAADVINSICKELARGYFFYADKWKLLNDYCNCYWPKNIAWLRSTYFNSPWNMIALFAGIILFSLSVVQTIFTIKST